MRAGNELDAIKTQDATDLLAKESPIADKGRSSVLKCDKLECDDISKTSYAACCSLFPALVLSPLNDY